MHDGWTLLLAILTVLAAHAVVELRLGMPALNGELIGPDSYMRLHRVLELYQRGHWYAPFESRINAPYGETLPHWSRALDGILLGGAWLVAKFTDFRAALLIWGAAFKPLLLVLLVPIWSWGTRDFLGRGSFVASLALLVLLPQLDFGFRVGRTDHHGVLSFLFFAQLALVLRIARGRGGSRHAFLAGMVSAASLWVSVEAQVQFFFVAAVFWLLWLWRAGNWLRLAAIYAIGLSAMTVPVLVLEHAPSQWATPLYARVSLVHLVLVSSFAMTWTLLVAANLRAGFDASVRGRLIAALAGAVFPLAMTVTLFPRLLDGPFVDFGSTSVFEWLATIPEYQSLIPTSAEKAMSFLLQLGPAVIALVYLALRWRPAGAVERNTIAVFAVGLAVYLPLALGAVRWVSYVQVLILAPWTLAIIALSGWYASSTAALFRPPPLRGARAVIERRGIDLVLVCKYSHKNVLYIGPNDEGLLASLVREQAPPWLEKVPLPDRLSTMFGLFRFAPPGSSGQASRRPREAE